MTPRRVVVAGGGITGLTVAHRLLAASRKGEAGPVQVTLLEARGELGGNIRTERRDGFVIDGGPDAWVVAKPHATQLCRELGLGDRIVETTERNRRVYFRTGGALHPLPEGMVLMIPTRFLPFATTPVLSWTAKARMALDLVLPRGRGQGDESIGHFIRRRLGSEALEQLAEPLLGGIYAGDVDALSLRSTFPQLAELEGRHRSMILGALAQRRARGRAPGPPPSAFHSLLGGVGELIEALSRAVRAAGGDVHTGAAITAIARAEGPGGPDAPRFAVHVAGAAEPLLADDVVVALPAHAAADALSGLDLEIASSLRLVPYLSTATVLLAYRRADIAHPLDAVGVILPRSEGCRALAATFASSKWPGRAPEDAALLRVFLGGHRDPGVLAQGDDALAALAREELAALIDLRARPILSRVFRFERANAQPVIGHAERLRVLRERAARHPGLHFAGAAFEGVGIPDCVRQANEVAEAIAAEV
ncbi:MAG: protoporphyrinogen oxidase [Polyangiaceae bacterium]|nr:protoporphyrinogen oxidase [Polyangiaceae bacterium]